MFSFFSVCRPFLFLISPFILRTCLFFLFLLFFCVGSVEIFFLFFSLFISPGLHSVIHRFLLSSDTANSTPYSVLDVRVQYLQERADFACPSGLHHPNAPNSNQELETTIPPCLCI